jgi:drug/metabolite transporter (DMT)-like permease
MGHSGTGTTILLVLIILMVIGFSIPTVRNGVSVIMITIAAVIYMIIISAAFAFWLLMLIDCLKRPTERFPNRGESDKLIWCLAIFFVHFIGAVLYYYLVMRNDSR